MSERALSFPFTAIVGMDDGKRSLECALVNPHIRAVLLRGGSGTAKTTLARAAAGITDRVIVNCPLNVTEEQLFGGMDVEEAIKTVKPEKVEPKPVDDAAEVVEKVKKIKKGK